MKKIMLKHIELLLLFIIMITSACGIGNKDIVDNNTIGKKKIADYSIPAYNNAVQGGYMGNAEEWLESVVGKKIDIKDSNVWIDGIDTSIKAAKIKQNINSENDILNNEENSDVKTKSSVDKTADSNKTEDKETHENITEEKKDDLEVSAYHINVDNHVILELSDDQELDIGSIEYIKPEQETGDAVTAATDAAIADNVKTDTDNAPKDNGSVRTDNISTVKLSIDNVEAVSGDKNIKVCIRLEDNPGILGMTLSLSYDDKNLILNNIENGAAFKDILTLSKGKELKSGCKLLWDGLDISGDDIKNGEILIMDFDIAEKASKGSYPIEISYDNGDVVDRDLNAINPNIENGSIIVKQ